MKVINSSSVSSFGGLNFVLSTFDQLELGQYLENQLPALPEQSKYSWKDIFYSFWSIFFCGGDCIEDLSIHLKPVFKNHPKVNLPSPDRVLQRLRSLSVPGKLFTTSRGNVTHHFSVNDYLNQLNIGLLNRLSIVGNKNNVLDYDNTFIFNRKADAANTYKKKHGYCPGVGMIGSKVVYVENRNGNSNPETLQHETLERMFTLLRKNNISIKAFRADGASYTMSSLQVIAKYSEKFYVRARVYDTIAEILKEIKHWREVKVDDRIIYRASIQFMPFQKSAKRTKRELISQEYRLIISKEKRDDGQINLFTGEACNYRAILTNDFDMTEDQVVIFYNQRGAIEREFDVLKNDFGWNHMPFSKLEQNTVFLIATGICRNLYEYIIRKFSKTFRYLKPNFRIKKFIFRFICIPAKWVITGREYKLRVYGSYAFKT
jgi:hypothetical protein